VRTMSWNAEYRSKLTTPAEAVQVIDRGKSVYAFIMAENPDMISINACVEADLYGQVSSESSGSRHISGTGGQLDFAMGAYMGISFICCNSSFTDKEGRMRSNVVPTLPAGSTVAVPRTQTHMIVTEWRIADLAGLSTWQRAEALVSIAHPELRDELIRAAEEQRIWRRWNKAA
jgi:acyl-CoA hydrolase